MKDYQKPEWLDRADEALKRAALRAREVATRTGTPLCIVRDGKIVKLMLPKKIKR